ncbi:unnamed protein product [Leuciscus chuanchicus]
MDVACQKTDEHDKRRAEDNVVTREKKREIEFVIGGRTPFLSTSRGGAELTAIFHFWKNCSLATFGTIGTCATGEKQDTPENPPSLNEGHLPVNQSPEPARRNSM